MFAVYNPEKLDNVEVTKFYLETIYLAIKSAGKNVVYFDYDSLPKKDTFIIVPTVIDFLLMWLRGYKNICVWIQGVIPEESFMKHNSILRYSVLSFIEGFAVNRSRMLFLVSGQMQKHLEKKYSTSISQKCLIMPCFNSAINKDSFQYKDKYNKNNFVYVGSLSVWQCFEESINLYKEFELVYPENTKLYVFTKEVEKAKIILEQAKIKCFEVEYVKSERINDRLVEMKYGFLLRDDHIVNNVATPTKMSNYLSNGIIPIVSKSINSFYEEFQDKKYFLFHSKNEDVCIDDVINFKPQIDDIFQEYSDIFNNYYSRHKYINTIGNKIKDIMV